MKIASATLQMESSHASMQQHELKENLRVWADNRRSVANANQASPSSPSIATSAVQISDAGRSAQSNEANAIEDGLKAANDDPMLRLIRAMIAILTGREIQVFDASSLDSPAASDSQTANAPNPSLPANAPSQATPAAPLAPTRGAEYTRQESYRESEQTSFSASGVIRTSDGKTIDFSLALSMSRSYSEESSISVRQGTERKTQDPLVINFGGTAAQLTDRRFKFDLNADGTAEDINFVSGGSGFLVLDRNGDGKVNNGSELFGVANGDGFADLSALDSDHNGWIDENDSAYGQLRIWTKDAAGKDQLSTLKQADVGAISLAHAATSFDLKTGNNELLGRIKSSGVYLHESGIVGTIQNVDLTV